MKYNIFFLFLIVATLFSCKEEVKLTFENPLNSARTDEVIVLTKSQVEQKLELKEGMLPIFELTNKTLIPSQIDDMNGDGNWDEVAFVLDFKAEEKVNVIISAVPEAEYPEFEKRTNLRLGIRQQDGSFQEFDNYRALPCNDGFEIIAQAESVSWENDKIGFRVYFDCRNVKDLFGKRKPDLIIDKIQTPEILNYHELADWGMDVLHCGSSLGSGGLALMRNDSLFRLGSTDLYEYRKITEGPVRSIFDLQYKGWNVNGEKLEAVEHISVYPGKYWFESDVTVKGCTDTDQIVTGIVTSRLKREPFEFQSAGFQCIGTHDIQSLNNDELGMAVAVRADETGKIGRTTNINFFQLGNQTVVEKSFSNIISETYYIGQKCQNEKPAKHYFFAVWGLEKEQWKTEEGFKKYISEEVEKLSSPIKAL